MALEDVVIITIASITIFTSIIVLFRYLPEIRKFTKEQKEASEIVKGVISELNNRLDLQDQKILDQQVRLDVLELKLDHLSKALGKEGKEEVKPRGVQDTERILEEVKGLLKDLSKSEEPSKRFELKNFIKKTGELKELSPTEELVLKLLKEGEQTPKQIQQKINKSREHTARLMKRLFELGYVTREDQKKPYVYKITEKGESLIRTE
ncbi:MAG: winged helix-turn-helix domain-containing protein [Nitrososphaerales archaeon]